MLDRRLSSLLLVRPLSSDPLLLADRQGMAACQPPRVMTGILTETLDLNLVTGNPRYKPLANLPSLDGLLPRMICTAENPKNSVGSGGQHLGATPARMAMTKTTTPPRFKRTARSRRAATPLTGDGVAAVEGGKRAAEEGQASSAPEAACCDATPVIRQPIAPPSEVAILPARFFLADALDLAPRLLGKLLRRDDVTLRITEVEAYRPNDTACHGRFGLTARTAPLFGPGGHAYVYMCYGLHMMLNIVADKEGVGAAVLIRSCSPVTGLKTIQQRRGQKTEKPVLLAGPGKVGQALGLSTEWSSHPLYTPGGLELLDGPAPEKILVGPRVGIEYASPEHVSAPWRFAIADSPWISAPKNALRSS